MPTQERKRWVEKRQATHSITIAMSCAIMGLSRSAYYYQPKLPDHSMIIAILSDIAERHLRWVFLNVFIALESSVINGIVNGFTGCIVS
ncbi:hypothetical protein GQ591_12135, partial [Gilliamella sp. Lep-s5]|nr:hypothetical protein [Gilliamella sp. Lep-s35]MWP70218.1 hypothetical protein [Gilliamella sp. Lep-s5]